MEGKLPGGKKKAEMDGPRGVQYRAGLFCDTAAVLFIRKPKPVAWRKFFVP